MVKKGPCSHCKINSTPLWRNGPADKPVLCNACGSRYKVKGHLDNYLPKNVHVHHNKNFKNVSDCDDSVDEDQLPYNVTPTPDGNNNNSTPDFHPISPQEFWDKIPTKKRSPVIYRRMKPIERFQKQLVSLYRSAKQNEESLLVDNVTNCIPSHEIGLGVILLKTDYASTDPVSITYSSIDNQAQCESSTITP